jgi:mRNA-degrading endonuclease toxin of MazEF toxin-antitoxin module
MSRTTSRVTCQGTRTRGIGKVVNDEPHEAKLSTTSRATCRGTRTPGVGEVVDDELHGELRHLDVQRG